MRRAPQQDRAARRLAAFLDAGAGLFAEVGYEAATMTEVAERCGSSIGALYSYFPDKKSLALALINQYAKEIAEHWQPLMDRAPILTHRQFADMFIDRITEYVQERPAYLKLVSAPIRFSRDPAAKRALRVAIASAFRAKNPSLKEDDAMLAANITLQLVRGMTTLYAEASIRNKATVTAEFKKILTLYLQTIL